MSHQDVPLRTFKKSESGQAVTEYILVLVVLVAIILGGMYQLNTAFQAWANNYFGEYLTCLLETGELPSIGGAPGDSGICNELFKPFSWGEGRRHALADKPGSGYTPSESRGGDGRGGGMRETASAGSTVRSSSSGGSSGMGGSRRSSSFRGRGQNVTSAEKEKPTYTGSTESSLPSGAGYRGSNNNDGRPQYVRYNAFRGVDTQDEAKEAGKNSSGIKRDGASASSDKRIRIVKRDIAKTSEVKDEPFTIGNFFRLLIIAAIIIALVMLIGGQILQISKNSE